MGRCGTQESRGRARELHKLRVRERGRQERAVSPANRRGDARRERVYRVDREAQGEARDHAARHGLPRLSVGGGPEGGRAGREASRRAVAISDRARVARVRAAHAEREKHPIRVGTALLPAVVPQRALRRVRPVGARQVAPLLGRAERKPRGARVAVAGPVHADEAAVQARRRGRRVLRGHDAAARSRRRPGQAPLSDGDRAGQRDHDKKRTPAALGWSELRRRRVSHAAVRPPLHVRPPARQALEREPAGGPHRAGRADHRLEQGAERRRVHARLARRASGAVVSGCRSGLQQQRPGRHGRPRRPDGPRHGCTPRRVQHAAGGPANGAHLRTLPFPTPVRVRVKV